MTYSSRRREVIAREYVVYAATQIAGDNTQWSMSLKALVFVFLGMAERKKTRKRSQVDQEAGFEEYGGLENGGWGGREQSEGAAERGSRGRCVDEWAEAGWRLGVIDIFGLIEWLID